MVTMTFPVFISDYQYGSAYIDRDAPVPEDISIWVHLNQHMAVDHANMCAKVLCARCHDEHIESPCLEVLRWFYTITEDANIIQCLHTTNLTYGRVDIKP